MGFKALVVEDDGLVLRAIKRILSKCDVDIMCATNGETGLELFYRKKFDIVVTDIMLGGLDGITMAQRICDRYPETPVIFVSARSDTAAEALKVVTNGFFLEKPFHNTELQELVKWAQAIIANTHSDVNGTFNKDFIQNNSTGSKPTFITADG